ncbi:uncharacterized protein LOC125203510 [Salvia hispanica]|uniref:uncharacterized protein LOC125203510 n=1 Tax=Salvia hispanica TaxID=49212 RepID=UPI002008F1D0|nr:uncharacterized protein LOC125203510 [Salvia hispanica]
MTSIASFFRPDTFWALCNRCNVQYEYTNIFLNQTLLCYGCHQPFLATSIPVQSCSSRPRPFPNQQQQDMHAAAQLSHSRTSQAPSSHAPINMERENGPSSVPERADTASASHTASLVLNKERPAKRRNTRELSQRNMRAMLIGKAKTEILHQLNEWEKKTKVTSSLSNGQDMGNVVPASCNNSSDKK